MKLDYTKVDQPSANMISRLFQLKYRFSVLRINLSLNFSESFKVSFPPYEKMFPIQLTAYRKCKLFLI